MTPLQILESEFLSHTNRVVFKPGLEGQTIGDDGTIFIGDRAGPELEITNLCHEMAHFVEIDDARMTCRKWGLQVRKVVICGQECLDPRTTQITEREMRVAAYQSHLQELIGVSESIDEITKSFRWLPDFTFIPLENGRPAFGEGSDPDVPYEEIDPSRLRWIANRTRELRSVYTLERFVSEWHRKIKLLA